VHNGEPGAQMRLSSLQGKPVLIDFWATWCGPCQLEAPILSRVAERYRDRGLVVLGVNTSDKAGQAAIFATRKGLSYPILFDDKGLANELYGVEALPTMVMIGKDGTVKAVRTGLVDEGAIDAMIGAELLP
jgi:cytochrome c biogenesis protein CcmG, thiol:disulfide interchange protein DsbE